MTHALIALHYQNDICHAEGRIPFAVDRSAPEPTRFLERSLVALAAARSAGVAIIHIHIAFASDYADLPRNCRLFRAVEELGAVKAGSWGAGPFAGFEPCAGETCLTHRGNSAFFATGLDETLKSMVIAEVAIMGLATQFSVEHTARDAADRGYGVTILKDCCGSANRAASAASLDVMGMLADVMDSSEWRRRVE